jgi:sugar O-acyltransferase (sialic acid O-acetyltransferase NeuD family)
MRRTRRSIDGGHGGVVLDALRLCGEEVVGVCDPALDASADRPDGLPVLDVERLAETHPPSRFAVANGVGFMPGQTARRALFEDMSGRGYEFTGVRHPSAVIAGSAIFGDGVQVMAGAIIQNACNIGANTIVNTGAQLDHGCKIGAFSHICPGAILSGDVEIGEGAFVGAGAIVVNGLRIGHGAVIGAGSVVTREVADNGRVVTPLTRDLAT